MPSNIGSDKIVQKPNNIKMISQPVKTTDNEAQNSKLALDYWIVSQGDTLCSIARDPQIFGNYLKWTLIYEANKDQIYSPDYIYPGQKLIIPLN